MKAFVARIYTALYVLLLFPSSCTYLTTINERHEQNSQLLEQQTNHLSIQEEYLAQLLETQQQQGRELKLLHNKIAQQQTDELSLTPNNKAHIPTVDDLAEALNNKQILGRVEWAWIELLERNLKARIDTGALFSSLNAIDLQPFERDGNQWIKFRVPDEEHPDGGDLYEAPLARHVRIRQASANKLDRRPVIQLSTRVGNTLSETEFTLTNREEMLYPILLGRNFLQDVFIVDVALVFTQKKYTPNAVLTVIENE
jgi:hypothetical protein